MSLTTLRLIDEITNIERKIIIKCVDSVDIVIDNIAVFQATSVGVTIDGDLGVSGIITTFGNATNKDIFLVPLGTGDVLVPSGYSPDTPNSLVTKGYVDAETFEGFDIAFFISGAPSSSQIVAQFVAVRAVDFPMNLPGSQGFASTAATASTDFDIQKNGGSIGTMNFAISGTVATFTFASSVSFAIGDVFKVISPASPDATLENISMTFKGVRI